ncbi:MAG: ubiquinol-cytochrome c reductase iron-sulfur subunit [Pseudomonadota bacterium]
MSDSGKSSRRHFLSVATAVTGGVGSAFALAPFVVSLKPSARAQALGAPVEIDVSALQPGEMVRVEWRGKPVWVLNRTAAMLERLPENDGFLSDPNSEEDQQPEYAANGTRSRKSEYLVVIGSCTHLGCAPLARFEVQPADLGSDWFGGFYCPCHGSKFDLAGRVYKGVPAPLNLAVPPYRFVSDDRILVGAEEGVA